MLNSDLAIFLAFWINEVYGHVYLLEPPSRNVLRHMAGQENCPHCLQSGGPNKVKSRSQGIWPTMLDPDSHGLCGDPVQGHADPGSIANMEYMQPSQPQRTYTAGSIVEFVVGISTHHWGHYEFRICDRVLDTSLASAREGQDCLNTWTLQRADPLPSCGNKLLDDCQRKSANHPERWYLPPPRPGTQSATVDWSDSFVNAVSPNDEMHRMRYVIPADLSCDHCTLQWYYATGNTCAYDSDYLVHDPGFKFWNHYKASWATPGNTVCSNIGVFGEEFWNCADIRVVNDGVVTPPTVAPPDSQATDQSTLTTLTTTIASQLDPEPEPEPRGTPVERHGDLRVQGKIIVGKHGRAVRLRGMSLFWSQWSEGSKFYSRDTVLWLRDDWRIDVIRAAMGVEHGGYLSNANLERSRVETVCDAAIEFGLYCIIDWHDHNADQHVSEAQTFFAAMSSRYKNVPNVIFETFNEPIGQQWSSVIKPYHNLVLQSIRANSQNLVILGSSTWSQDVDIAAGDPIQDTNVAYTVHFYASTHYQQNRNKVIVALNAGLAIFATEWGVCSASGNGALDLENTRVWLDFLAQHSISDLNWAISDKVESCAALQQGASPALWHLNQLTESGAFMRNSLRSAHGTSPQTTGAPLQTGATTLQQQSTSTAAPAITSHLDAACSDVKDSSECESADATWQMCQSGQQWWYDQCHATCSQCATTTLLATSSQSGCDATCLDVKDSAECQGANAMWLMCESGDTWWYHQCRATCSKCASGRPPCTQTPTTDSDCSVGCQDVKPLDECLNADGIWSMCSSSDSWWHSQCRATCSKCIDGKPPCTDGNVHCGNVCRDRKSEEECVHANIIWNMCSSGQTWWLNQCSLTCGECANAGCPVDEVVETLTCDMHCLNKKPLHECEAANTVWGMCSHEGSWYQNQCKAFCSKCKDGLSPCSGELVAVSGGLVLNMQTASPESYTDSVIAQNALKKAVAKMAGNGVDPADVVDLILTFTQGRRLQVVGRQLSVAGSLHVSYTIYAPSSISTNISSKLVSRGDEEVQNIIDTALHSVGQNSNFSLQNVSMPQMPQVSVLDTSSTTNQTTTMLGSSSVSSVSHEGSVFNSSTGFTSTISTIASVGASSVSSSSGGGTISTTTISTTAMIGETSASSFSYEGSSFTSSTVATSTISTTTMLGASSVSSVSHEGSSFSILSTSTSAIPTSMIGASTATTIEASNESDTLNDTSSTMRTTTSVSSLSPVLPTTTTTTRKHFRPVVPWEPRVGSAGSYAPPSDSHVFAWWLLLLCLGIVRL